MSQTVRYLQYTLTLQAPAIVTSLSGDPNSVATQRFISGTAIRGALAGRLLANGSDVEGDDFRTLILGGRVRYLHAYPAKDSTRALPTPIPWRHEKGQEGGSTFDLASYSGQIDEKAEFDCDENGRGWPTVSLVRENLPPFVAYDGSWTFGVNVDADARMHHQRDREKGRAWKVTRDDRREESHGALFTYEFLEADQTFHGMIQVIADSDDELDAILEKIKEILRDQTILVGRSRRAGYGGAARLVFGGQEPHEASWGEVQRGDVLADSRFRVYLLSACAVRDPETGQLDPTALIKVLIQRLGGEEVVCAEGIFWEFELVGGFNRKWRLELPQALAVKAGSILVLKSRRDIPSAKLREIEHVGLGERRIEGFGRLVFLSHSDSPKPRTVTIEKSKDKATSKEKSSGTRPPDLVMFLQQRILDTAVDRALDRKVKDLVDKSSKIPTGSLLGRLRIPLRAGDPEAGLETLQRWLRDPSKDRAALRNEAQNKLHGCKLAKGTLHHWLVETATAASGTKVGIKELARKHEIIDREFGRVIAEGRGAYYAVRLIDAVLAALARKGRGKGSSDRDA